jgi:hypothetical protein
MTRETPQIPQPSSLYKERAKLPNILKLDDDDIYANKLEPIPEDSKKFSFYIFIMLFDFQKLIKL